MTKNTILTTIGIVLYAFIIEFAISQNLPAPSREVFRCEEKGKIVYSDTPCVGAKKIDVEPTRGFNKDTGQERIGNDVRREQHTEIMANALHPILGETPEQYKKRQKRFKLSPQDRTECYSLDGRIENAEQAEKNATKQNLTKIQVELFRLRTSFRNLQC